MFCCETRQSYRNCLFFCYTFTSFKYILLHFNIRLMSHCECNHTTQYFQWFSGILFICSDASQMAWFGFDIKTLMSCLLTGHSNGINLSVLQCCHRALQHPKNLSALNFTDDGKFLPECFLIQTLESKSSVCSLIQL